MVVVVVEVKVEWWWWRWRVGDGVVVEVEKQTVLCFRWDDCPFLGSEQFEGIITCKVIGGFYALTTVYFPE
ncbi:hypothetical protein RHGRI_007042 [Rhododendron griersonianum]|uniref:Uncharacterized protein n=1 Tax=Rhododendron griersonianum TaxID=479676 RepID=A0AAV6KVS4_9ERIC|nr:hypothetical protein RHGRI_007042 [Rhododendron griersonianum]